MVDDKVKIKCSKCSTVFRERAQKVRPNAELNCPHCNGLITFDMASENTDIRKALSNAKQIRLMLETLKKPLPQLN